MNFLEEIKELQNDRNSKEDLVISEIVEFFKNKMDSENFTKYLKENYIKKAIENSENKCSLNIKFWEYHSGCSQTHIRVSACGTFELKGTDEDYDSYYSYKGIELLKIHKRLCSKISELYKEKLSELGLKIVSSERHDNEYRFGYYKEEIIISW